ncbi:unnamed protein product [Acanthoscelides obtectus]|uniref:Reverse transcriptase domain-containing protein n=1 Tax=Acanthoscelides obtectus TaxID=200917 RepID=A0A9P0VSF7_ACAOB|nr:unnamed protein product [Acanthoscelides obtectus]CAK1688487.1 hypothetical protein AOBTE_LOCUS36735 [Acanthoscelides obtectus]
MQDVLKNVYSKTCGTVSRPKCPVGAAAAAPPPESTDSETDGVPSNRPIPESVGVACPDCGERVLRPRCTNTAPAAPGIPLTRNEARAAERGITASASTDDDSTEPVSTDTGDGRATVPQEEAPETNSCEEAGVGGGSPIPVPELLDVSAVAAIAGGENNVNNITPTAENISPTQTPDMSERVLNVSEDELVSPAASPEEILLRQDVAQTARSCKLTRAAQQHLEVNTVTQLLRNAISEACDLPMGQPQSQIDTLHDRVTALFVSEERGVAGDEREGVEDKIRGVTDGTLYARTQDIYKKEPGILAKHVLNNVDWLEEPGVKKLQPKTCGTCTKSFGAQIRRKYRCPSWESLRTGTWVRYCANRRDGERGEYASLSDENVHSTPGPDGIKKGDINAFLVQTKSSSYFQFNHDKRKLRAKARFSPRQKGFMNESGCFNNIHILNELLRHSKAKNGLVVTQLDVSKAFDTVPHQAIGHALRRKRFSRTGGLELDSGEVIPVAGAGDHLVYLGCKLSPWVGVTTEGIRADLASTLSRVQRLKLKPHQKVDLISTYIVPHYLYQLSIAMPAMTQIKLMDQELRVVVKNILHLPQATTNALLYCGKRDGGLAIPRLEWLATSSALKAGLKFVDNPDPAMQALATGTKLESRVRRLALDARIAWPVTGEQLASYTRTQKKAELARWKRLGSQGKSAAAFADSKIGNAWLRDPSLLKPCLGASRKTPSKKRLVTAAGCDLD